MDPALADILREEIKTFATDGNLPLTDLNELKKMDSVMRESARVNPFSHSKNPIYYYTSAYAYLLLISGRSYSLSEGHAARET